MKHFIYILFLLSITSTSCKKFLAEQSQDEVRPSNTTELAQLMSAEGYPYNAKLSIVHNLMTDDVFCYGGQGFENYALTVRRGRSAYSWSKEVYQDLLADGVVFTNNLNTWEVLYRKIAGCNVVLDYVSKVTGSQKEKNNLTGQALAMRAYYYFFLVNTYGQPYNKAGANPENLPGVPLKLTMAVTDSLFERNSVAEVYSQIENDLIKAADLLAKNNTTSSIYKMNELAALTLLSRVYLYQEKWDKTIEYANMVIAKKPNLSILYSFQGGRGGYYRFNNSFFSNSRNRIYDPNVSQEILWSYQISNTANPVQQSGEDEFFKTSLFPGYSAVNNPPYAVAPELLALYETRPIADSNTYLGDLRSSIYINYALAGFGTPLILKPYFGSNADGGIRLAEAYLNRAEAYTRKYMANNNNADRELALNDINNLRIARYDARQPYVKINITEAAALYAFYKDERRREFPFEGHRWFDLRRYGMPSMTHFYEETAGTGVTTTLAEGDSRYTLQIPRVVMERNGMLTPNP